MGLCRYDDTVLPANRPSALMARTTTARSHIWAFPDAKSPGSMSLNRQHMTV